MLDQLHRSRQEASLLRSAWGAIIFRICSILWVLALANGCADSVSPVQQVTSASPSTRPSQPASVKNSSSGTTQPSLPANADTKTVVVKSGKEATHFVLGGSPSSKRNVEQDKASFYPVLRNLKEGDFFTKTVVNSSIAEGLGIFACRKVKMPDGRVRIDYVLRRQVEEYGLKESDIINLCYENFFREKIEVQALKQRGDLMLSFSSTGGLVTAILGHSSTYAKFAKMLGADEMAILVDGPEHLLATSTGSSFEPTFYEIVQKSQHKSGALSLDPGVYHWTKKDGLKPVPRKPAN